MTGAFAFVCHICACWAIVIILVYTTITTTTTATLNTCLPRFSSHDYDYPCAISVRPPLPAYNQSS